MAFTCCPPPRPHALPATPHSHSYKNRENVDVSRVDGFARHDKDTGSPEYQVALLSARLQQISTHLATNKKDVAARRGLIAILSLRKRLLQYLYRKDRQDAGGAGAAHVQHRTGQHSRPWRAALRALADRHACRPPACRPPACRPRPPTTTTTTTPHTRRETYDKMLKEFNIRSVVANDVRGASREETVAVPSS